MRSWFFCPVSRFLQSKTLPRPLERMASKHTSLSAPEKKRMLILSSYTRNVFYPPSTPGAFSYTTNSNDSSQIQRIVSIFVSDFFGAKSQQGGKSPREAKSAHYVGRSAASIVLCVYFCSRFDQLHHLACSQRLGRTVSKTLLRIYREREREKKVYTPLRAEKQNGGVCFRKRLSA